MKNIILSFLLLLGGLEVMCGQEVLVHVDGVCGMCKQRIETTALTVSGVESAAWSFETHNLTILHNADFDLHSLHEALVEAGHDTDMLKASDEAYDNLHGCCKYRADFHKDVEKVEGSDVHEENSTEKQSSLQAYVDSHDHTNPELFVHGMVYTDAIDGNPEPLIGASVTWIDESASTTTDIDGFFELPKVIGTSQMIVSYVGFRPDTINIGKETMVAITMETGHVLDDVTITYRKKTTHVSFIDPLKVSTISKKELCKAACCSLSESFETNPAVDVSFTDAVTGTRKIELLGLAGPYVQIMRSNIPYIRGLSAINGLSTTPGPWIESMQLNVGAGSVVNGSEGMTGQINVQPKSSLSDERVFVNLFANQMGRLESNVNAAVNVSKELSSALLYHGSMLNREVDGNKDGFLDNPLSRQLYLMNINNFQMDNGLRGEVGAKYTYSSKHSGTLSDQNLQWLADMDINRIEGWSKTGFVFKDKPYNSIGLQLSGLKHTQDGHFGARNYDGEQTSFAANLIGQTILRSTDHVLKLGASFSADAYDETLAENNYFRNESTTGLFAEVNSSFNKYISLVVGVRGDYHNIYGYFVSPRIHLKYSPNESSALRFAYGTGRRSATVVAENIGMLASNRSLSIDKSIEQGYGLDAEISSNISASYTQEVVLNNHALVFSADYYYTAFNQQVVVDYEEVGKVSIYNKKNGSVAHSVSFQLDYEIVKGLDIRAAYRYNDVMVDYKSGIKAKAFLPKHRAFANVAYAIGRGWEVDATYSWNGSQRLPSTSSNPAAYQRSLEAPSFSLLNYQITKKISAFDIYVGMENALNYRQENPIIASNEVQSRYFDSSMVWGPIMGRNTYIGLRYTLK